MAGDIDDAGDRAVGQSKGGKAEVDGDAPGLLLLEAVGVGAGEGLDQRGLAVVDVAGGADDDVVFGEEHLL